MNMLQIAIVEVAQVQFDVVVDQVPRIGAENVIHVDVANDDVDVFLAMHLDVVTICC